MSVNNGTLIAVFIGSVKLGHCTSHDLSIKQALRDVTTKDSKGWSESAEGLRSWGIGFQGLFSEDDETQTTLMDAIEQRTSLTIKWQSVDDTDDPIAGTVYYTGTAWVSETKQDAKMEDNQTITGTFVGSGPIVKAIVA